MVKNFSKFASLLVLVTLAFVGVKISASAKSEINDKKILKKAWTILREAITNEDSQIRETVVQGLEYIEGPQALNGLQSSLSDESEYVRIWAARSLARRGDFSGKKTLLSILLTSQEPSSNATGPLAALAKMKSLARGRVRGEAAKTLGLFRDEDIPVVLKNAKRDNDGRVRDGAAVGLSLLGDKTEAIVFCSALKDADKGIRLAAAEALASIKDPDTAEALLLIVDDPEESIRSTAARALGASKAKEGIQPVGRLMTDPSGVVRESAAWALGEMGSQDAMPFLRVSLNDPNPYVQLESAAALGKIGNSSGLGTLEAALNSNDMEARGKAAHMLSDIKDKKAEALAVKTMDDGNLKVRLGAALSLFKFDKSNK